MSKIYVKEYLKHLNVLAEDACKHGFSGKVEYMTCAMLAEKVSVTPATISNLNTDSKASLIYKLANEIYDNYQYMFEYLAYKAGYEWQGEQYCPTDVGSVMLDLVHYYGFFMI